MKRNKWMLAAALLLCLLLGMTTAAAAGDSSLSYRTNVEGGGNTSISLQRTAGGDCLFLPASADLQKLTLWFSGDEATLSAGGKWLAVRSGQPFDLTALFAREPADGVYAVTFTQGQKTRPVKIMRSANMGSLYLTSADPAKDRTWVEKDKDKKAKGSAVLLRADGTPIYNGGLKQIKGRGNSTWDYPKKPYQIKLADKTDLLETGDPAEAESTWVLLANYCDETMIHNSLTYDLAAEAGLKYSPHNAPVDLYYDGEYRGTYLLSEKTEVGDGRVAVDDLEGKIEDANPDMEDLDSLATASGVNQFGNHYQYVAGLALPEDFSGGYLLELDFPERAKAEKSWFATTGGKHVVCKSPEYLPQEAMEYISGFYQEFEDAVFAGGVNPATGKDYTEYVDVESLAKCYLILELSQDGDAFQSSTFFYKPAGEEKLYAGPLWDFDSAYGSTGADVQDQRLVAGQTLMGRKLLAIPSFRAEVQRCYEELYPLIKDIALSTQQDTHGTILRSIPSYGAQCAASQKMNAVLWPERSPANYRTAVQSFQTFVSQRNQWLYHTVMSWTEDTQLPIQFADVPQDAWYAGAVDYVASKGLMSGTSEIYFSPQKTMNRAMAVTVLHRLAGSPAVTGGSGFSDVPQDAWYSQAVAWAVKNHVADGYPGGVFKPENRITRQELVTLFYRYAKTTGADVAAPAIPANFADRNQVQSWAKAPFGWAIHQKIITGTDAHTLSPQGKALRSQAAALFQRYSEAVAN